MAGNQSELPPCSVIIPVRNSAPFLEECILSVHAQLDYPLGKVELIIFNDASTDESLAIAHRLQARLSSDFAKFIVLNSTSDHPSGAGSGRNRCCEASGANFFVFLDSDDIMRPYRLARTIPLLQLNGGIVGGVFDRVPPGSTPRYERFHRNLTNEQISSNVYTFRDAPIAMPTCACTRASWETAGKFREGPNIPEDLHFPYDAIERGIRISKLDGDSITGYRFHDTMTSLSYNRKTLLSIRVDAFERIVLSRPRWRDGFSIWGAGRDGKEFYKALSEPAKKLVQSWGDIDPNKIGNKLREKPVIHFSQLQSPVAICVAMDRDGQLERNLKETNLVGGVDYYHLV